MKRIITYSGLIFTLMLAACDDFLKVDSPSKFEKEYIYGSEEEIFRALSGVYNPLTTDPLYSGRMTTSYRPNTDVEMQDASETPSAGGGDIACYEPRPIWTDVKNSWTEMYNAINKANYVIEGIESSPLYEAADKTKPSNLLQMYGEAKTLRAMLYLDLVRNWGDVPLRLKPTTSEEELAIPATDRNEILSSLIEDLKKCEPTMLYASEITQGVERASREFCQGLITLMAMNRGGWTLRPVKNDPLQVGYMERADDYKEYYELAELYAGKVIKEGKHDLKLGFKELWVNQSSHVVTSNDDIIFDIPLLKGTSSEFGYYTGIPITAGTHAYGSASGGFSLSWHYLFSFDPKDLRRDVTCALYSYNADLNQEVIKAGVVGVKAGKWCKLHMKEPMGSTSTKGTGINYTFMRFADILLLYAEAANENNNGPTEEAKEALKRVRRRAFAPDDWAEKVDAYVDALTDKERFFEALVNERKWEFGGENIRKYDLARWNLYSKTIYNLYHELIAIGKNATGEESNEKYQDYPLSIYWKSVPDPENSGRTILDIVGIDKQMHSGPSGYTKVEVTTGWWANNKETGNMEPHGTIKRAFRGYINPNNAESVNPETDPVRYLMPIPSDAIYTHQGTLTNYYGFQ